MKLTASFLIAFAASVYATPIVPRDDPPKDTPVKTHIYVCLDADFKGTCQNFEVEPGKCYNVTDDWNDKISSGGPDKDTFCAAYQNYECNGKAFPFTYPGIRDLTRYGYSDVISSYRCDWLGGFEGPK
ncbi:hypothetical protein P280DRAFT_288047 [Massarina eburnea CBS 473.64]|uniref:Beta/gamma crystallin 'Greek key' domain-containing protein n=1 Tax=Massarina eburnea CBS 473.64 TaxID=1395130 RepID=A0A6A6S274_9PLEO|nr:hypothetical protein P280DRAFT_288047 [Massarina eburnea CBS 473.64]